MAIFFVSGEDGRSRAEQLLHILRQLDPYVSSSAEHQRRRGCIAVHEVLIKFRNLCSGGFGALGSYPTLTLKQIDQGGSRSLSSLPCMLNIFLYCYCNCMIYEPSRSRMLFYFVPAAFVLPNRDSLSLGERVMAYLPRCADTDDEVRKVAIQVRAESSRFLFLDLP
jgi:hypothetical protein